MGGLNQGGSEVLLMRQGTIQRATIGGYFQLRLPSPYSVPLFNPRDYLTKPHEYNQYIQDNIDLLCGDAMLELQSNAISTLANNQIPGTNTWVAIINWLNDFIQPIEKDYDMVFLDANPSFSMYTQIAIATSTKMVLPVMADDSSPRAIQNAFSLVYGLKLPSEIYSKYELDNVHGLVEGDCQFISDTFYPELVQFGIIGIILYILFWRFIIKKLYQTYRKNDSLQSLKTGLLITSFIIIESIAGSVFLQGGGICAMMLLAMIIKNTFYKSANNNIIKS